jgi:hypothetical protein
MKRIISKTKRVLKSVGIIAVLLTGSINTDAQQELRKISGVEEVSYCLPGYLEISQGDQEELILNGNPEDLARITTTVEDGELKLSSKRGGFGIGDVKIFLTVRDLKSLSVSGSGQVVFKTELKTSDFELSVSGSGNVACEKIVTDNMEINLAGSGNVNIGGVLKSHLEAEIAGSGNIDASGLQAKEVGVSISGSGTVKAWAIEKLESNITGSGNVYYKGTPLVDAETVGSGKTKAL